MEKNNNTLEVHISFFFYFYFKNTAAVSLVRIFL